MEKLSSQISLLSAQEGELLSVDKLSKNRQSWIEYFGNDEKAPVSAIDWLLEVKQSCARD